MKPATALFRSTTGENWESSFLQQADHLAKIGASIGVQIVPYTDSSLPRFRELPDFRKQQVTRDLTTYNDICSATLQAGGSLRNNHQLIWAALKQFGLRPTSDFFALVPEGNVIEIHNREFVQIFRNFKFYECCSYTLEELYCVPWNELYTRPDSANAYLIEIAQRMFRDNISEILPMQVEPHIIEEVHSSARFQIEAQMKYLAPLFGEGTSRVEAHALIENGRILNPPVRPYVENTLQA